MLNRGVVVAVVSVLVVGVAGCSGGGGDPASSSALGPVSTFPARPHATRGPTTAPTTLPDTRRLLAPRADWTVSVPTGWEVLTGAEARALGEADVATTAARLKVDATLVETFRTHDTLELYASDPATPEDLRVLLIPQMVVPTREVLIALLGDFEPQNLETSSVPTPTGYHGAARFDLGAPARGYGGLLLGGVTAPVGTVALVVTADTAERRDALLRDAARGLAYARH